MQRPEIIVFEQDAGFAAALTNALVSHYTVIHPVNLNELELTITQRPIIGLLIHLDLLSSAFLRNSAIELSHLQIKIIGLAHSEREVGDIPGVRLIIYKSILNDQMVQIIRNIFESPYISLEA